MKLLSMALVACSNLALLPLRPLDNVNMASLTTETKNLPNNVNLIGLGYLFELGLSLGTNSPIIVGTRDATRPRESRVQIFEILQGGIVIHLEDVVVTHHLSKSDNHPDAMLKHLMTSSWPSNLQKQNSCRI